MNKKQKRMLFRILLTAVIYFPLLILNHTVWADSDNWLFLTAVFLVPYILIGWDIIFKAVRNIKNGQVFDENFLMCIATFGAFGVGEYSEAVAVMLFYQVGELFQSVAVNRSRQSISDLMNICPEYANIEKDGVLEQVDPDDVAVGDTIVIKAGERIPLDGVVISGESYVDTSALTGESVPRRIAEGDDIISGCVNGSGLLRVQVTKEFDDSTVARILELVENASSKKARVENFITRFARYYTPIVVICAVILAILYPLISGEVVSEGIRRACSFLVISCPCALVISVPMGFFGGIGAASSHGVLVKGSNYLELLAQMETIVFDKTGTLTQGNFRVTKVAPVSGVTKENLLMLAAAAEKYSDHPIAKSIQDAWKEQFPGEELPEQIEETKEVSGHGIEVKINGKKILAGNEKLMKQYRIPTETPQGIGTVVYLAEEGRYLGYLLISDTVKPQAAKAIRELKQIGVAKTVMLTGDKKEVGEAVARELGLDEVYAELLPGDKVEKVEELLEKSNAKVAFVGDGINDAPVLSRADIGIAMGSMGSDAAIEAADIVLMDDDPSKISLVVKIARKTLAIVKENIVFALGVKILVLLLATVGLANMWEAVFADVGVSVIAILNSMRALKIKKK